MMKRVNVFYYAELREQAGKTNEVYNTSASTAGDLYEELISNYKFVIPEQSLKVAINDVFLPWKTSIHDGDRVVFIPPVSGG